MATKFDYQLGGLTYGLGGAYGAGTAYDVFGVGRSGAGPYGRLGAGQSQEMVSSIDSLYRNIFGKGIPGEVFSQIKNDRSFAEQYQNYLQQIATQGIQSVLASAGSDTARQKLMNIGLATSSDLQTYNATALEEKALAEKKALAFDPTTDPIYSKVYQQLQDVIGKGEPTFISPTKSETEYTTEWQTKLAEMNKPVLQKALSDLTKQVGEQYAAYNPYSLGSGGQMKASESAVSNMLSQDLAQRNAQALALGQASYTRDYNKALADYEYQQQKLASAQNTMLGISQGIKGYEQQSYYDTLAQQRNIANQQAAYNYNQELLKQQQSYAEQIAQKYQQNQPSWYQQLATPILTGVGTALGGSLGAGIGSGIGSMFSGSSGQIPSSYYGGNLSLNYNPYSTYKY